jgi:glycosyltransferase involved in cell wall biosynthesis
MVRVAQVVTRFIAGAGGVALRGALALDADRFSVTILAADGGPLFDEAERAGLRVVRLRHMRPELSPLEDWRGLGELQDLLARGGFDLVHTHSAKAGALGRLAAHRIGMAGVVHTLHGFPFHEFQSPLRRRAYIETERRLGRITDQFLAIGSAVAAEAVRLGIAQPERIRSIASAIDPVGLEPATRAMREAARLLIGLPGAAKVVGTVGRLDYQKAPEVMVAAARGLDRPDVRFVWVGGGPLEQSVRRLIERSGLASRFLLLGERSDVKRLLPAFDVFAMASRYEGLPCAIVEAIAAGIPVVATAVNAVPEVVIPGRTGLLVPPAAPEQLGRALAYLLDNPDDAARMAIAARAAVGERFRPDELGRDLTDVYWRALGHAPGVVGLPLAAVEPQP